MLSIKKRFWVICLAKPNLVFNKEPTKIIDHCFANQQFNANVQNMFELTMHNMIQGQVAELF